MKCTDNLQHIYEDVQQFAATTVWFSIVPLEIGRLAQQVQSMGSFDVSGIDAPYSVACFHSCKLIEIEGHLSTFKIVNLTFLAGRHASWVRRKQLKPWLVSSKIRLRGFSLRRCVRHISFHLNMTHLLSSGPGGKILPTHPETSSGEIL